MMRASVPAAARTAVSIAPANAIASPCVKLCQIGPDHRCAGCYRTIDEIARWCAESAEWRAAIMAELPARWL